jgi:hypothetical protein
MVALRHRWHYRRRSLELCSKLSFHLAKELRFSIERMAWPTKRSPLLKATPQALKLLKQTFARLTVRPFSGVDCAGEPSCLSLYSVLSGLAPPPTQFPEYPLSSPGLPSRLSIRTSARVKRFDEGVLSELQPPARKARRHLQVAFPESRTVQKSVIFQRRPPCGEAKVQVLSAEECHDRSISLEIIFPTNMRLSPRRGGTRAGRHRLLGQACSRCERRIYARDWFSYLMCIVIR